MNHVCAECSPAFGFQRGMTIHRRRAHGDTLRAGPALASTARCARAAHVGKTGTGRGEECDRSKESYQPTSAH